MGKPIPPSKGKLLTRGLFSSVRLNALRLLILPPALQGQLYTASPKAVKPFFSDKCKSLITSGEFYTVERVSGGELQGNVR